MPFDTFPSVANADDVIKGISNSNERFMKFSNYELVPSDVQTQLIKDFEAKQTDE